MTAAKFVFDLLNIRAWDQFPVSKLSLVQSVKEFAAADRQAQMAGIWQRFQPYERCLLPEKLGTELLRLLFDEQSMSPSAVAASIVLPWVEQLARLGHLSPNNPFALSRDEFTQLARRGRLTGRQLFQLIRTNDASFQELLKLATSVSQDPNSATSPESDLLLAVAQLSADEQSHEVTEFLPGAARHHSRSEAATAQEPERSKGIIGSLRRLFSSRPPPFSPATNDWLLRTSAHSLLGLLAPHRSRVSPAGPAHWREAVVLALLHDPPPADKACLDYVIRSTHRIWPANGAVKTCLPLSALWQLSALLAMNALAYADLVVLIICEGMLNQSPERRNSLRDRLLTLLKAKSGVENAALERTAQRCIRLLNS